MKKLFYQGGPGSGRYPAGSGDSHDSGGTYKTSGGKEATDAEVSSAKAKYDAVKSKHESYNKLHNEGKDGFNPHEKELNESINHYVDVKSANEWGEERTKKKREEWNKAVKDSGKKTMTPADVAEIESKLGVKLNDLKSAKKRLESKGVKFSQELTSAFIQFVHDHRTIKGEPDWKTIDIQKLPQVCYEGPGMKYPHHYMDGGGAEDNHGRYTKGRPVVHVSQMLAMYDAAVKDKDDLAAAHLNDHVKTIDPDRDKVPLPPKAGMDAYFEEKTIPRFSFSAPVEMTIGDPVENKGSPVTLVALSGEILDRPEWGPCVQDLAGCMHGASIAIDYRHDANELLGYIDSFDISSGRLVLKGMLVPQTTHKRVEEVISNMRTGVPYEASIYFPPWKPDEMQIENIKEGTNIDINGRTLTAPAGGLTVFRRWSLRGVAICPHGADGATAAYLQKESAANVKVMVKHEQEKVKEVVMPGAEKEVEIEKEPTGEVEVVEEKPASIDAETLKKFAAKFGAAKAMEYLLGGKNYEASLEAFADEMKAAMESKAQAAPASSKHAQESKPGLKFVPQGASVPKLSSDDEQMFAQYAAANRWSAEKLAEMKKLHAQYKQDAARSGQYTPDPSAVPFAQGQSSLSKIGQE